MTLPYRSELVDRARHGHNVDVLMLLLEHSFEGGTPISRVTVCSTNPLTRRLTIVVKSVQITRLVGLCLHGLDVTLQVLHVGVFVAVNYADFATTFAIHRFYIDITS